MLVYVKNRRTGDRDASTVNVNYIKHFSDIMNLGLCVSWFIQHKLCIWKCRARYINSNGRLMHSDPVSDNCIFINYIFNSQTNHPLKLSIAMFWIKRLGQPVQSRLYLETSDCLTVYLNIDQFTRSTQFAVAPSTWRYIWLIVWLIVFTLLYLAID